MKKKIAAEAAAMIKDDPVQKAPDYTEKLLEEIDPVSVEVASSTFEQFLPGDDFDDDGNDIDEEILDALDFSSDDKKAESSHYDPLCGVFNDIATSAGYYRRFKIVANHPESSDVDFKSDMALYSTDSAAQEAYSRDVENESPDVARCAWAWMLCPIEVKCGDEDAGYGFDVPVSPGPGKKRTIPFLRETPKSREARAQFVKYCVEIMLRQHRTHVFAIYIADSSARFFRFDRAGCIASKPINMRDDFMHFRNLLFRLVNLPPAELGFDDTVMLADAAALRALRAHRPKAPKILKQYYNDYFNSDTIRYPIYKVTCPVVDIASPEYINEGSADSTQTEQETRTYLIGRYSAGHDSPTGRATRGYIAFELETRRMVFLKDCWRAVTRKHTEMATYRRLHQAGVESIATPIAGGDIDHHRTKSQIFMQDRPVHTRPVERVHTRLVTKEVGRSLETYEGSFELISYVFHAYMGHQEAWEKAGVLHHDVSIGNILIDVISGYGFMNDWDLAKYREDLEKGAKASEPAGVSGTWPFKSALALQFPRKPAELADDIESFIYIILYFAMRFHAHSLSPAKPQNDSLEALRAANVVNQDLAALYYDIFQAGERLTDGLAKGGQFKEICIRAAFVPVQLDDDEGKQTPLARFLQKAYQLLHRHYKRVNRRALERFGMKPIDNHADTKAKMAVLDRDNHEKGGTNLRAKWDMLGRRPVIKHYSPSSSGSSPSSKANSVDLRPLDTHDALLELFDRAFVNEDGTEMNIAKWRGDKVFDQFLGQPVMTASRRKNFTGVDLSQMIANARRTSSSRYASHPEGDELPTIAEEAPLADDANAESGRRRTIRKATSPKRKVATKRPPLKKATSSDKDEASVRATTARKASATRKAASTRKASADAKKSKTTAPAKRRVAKKNVQESFATQPVRRSARGTKEPVMLPPATGKRRRVEDDEDVLQSGAAATKRKSPTKAQESRTKAKTAHGKKAPASDENCREPPVRRSSRLAAKADKKA